MSLKCCAGRDYLVVSVVVVFLPSSVVVVVVFFFSPQPIANAHTIVTVVSKPKNFFIKTSKQGVKCSAANPIAATGRRAQPTKTAARDA